MLLINAPAKINWNLLVTGKRPDGFHSIESLMQLITLHDTLTFEPSDSITVTTISEGIDTPDIPLESNLVYKAACALQRRLGISTGVKFSLTKRIPLEAGMGGGSSDAAATIKGLLQLWDKTIPQDELIDIAASLGSDVPFFLGSPAAKVTGRGEVLEPVKLNSTYHLVLLKPQSGVSAGWAYSNVVNFTKEASGDLISILASGETDLLQNLMVNDLERSVIRKLPVIGDLKKLLIHHGAKATLMSGSGSTVFGVFDSEEEAKNSLQKISLPENTWSTTASTIAS